jgi:hypothetical protein
MLLSLLFLCGDDGYLYFPKIWKITRVIVYGVHRLLRGLYYKNLSPADLNVDTLPFVRRNHENPRIAPADNGNKAS